MPVARTENMHYAHERIFDSYWTPTEESVNQDIYFNDDDAIKIVVPPLRYGFNTDTIAKEVPKKEVKVKTLQNVRKPKNIMPLPEVSFEPKKEETAKFVITVLNDDETNPQNLCRQTKFVQPKPEKKWHYEVTEDSKNDDTKVASAADNSGYFYKIPLPENKDGSTSSNLLNTGKKNLTSTLQNILSKYNIHPKDKLNNYEVSRQTRMYFLPMSYISKRKQNRQNNLPVDTLSAVLLSNYGIYLPQFYKSNNNYKNLYGHLAFNNIHNNKPFGNYKLFSDTDYDFDDDFFN